MPASTFKIANAPIDLQRMGEAIVRLGCDNQRIGSDVTMFWLRGPLAISVVEQRS